MTIKFIRFATVKEQFRDKLTFGILYDIQIIQMTIEIVLKWPSEIYNDVLYNVTEI